MTRCCFYLLLLALRSDAVWSAENRASAKDLSIVCHVQLVLGTNQEKASEAKYRAIGPKLSGQLSSVFQWKNYWEVNHQMVMVQNGKADRVRLSKDCEVEIKVIPATAAATNAVREIRLFRKGALICKSKREIGSMKMSILGGDSKDGNSWFVVVRRDEPQYQ